MNPALVAAALDYWSNPRVASDLRCICIAISILAKGNQQSWCQNVTCAGQSREQIIVGQALGDEIDLGIESIDSLQEDAQLFDQGLHEHLLRTDDGRIFRQRSCITDALDAFLDQVCPVRIVLAEE